jgi:hypothetical protein
MMSDVVATFSKGVDPSKALLSSDATLLPIMIDYVATSTVNLQIKFVGGLTNVSMFGGETRFLVSALDPAISFTTIVQLGNSMNIPAIDYVVTLMPYNMSRPYPTVPKFNITGVTCAPSLDPYTYLQQTNKLSQIVTVDLTKSTSVTATFVYRSGPCLQVKGFGGEVIADSSVIPASGGACFATGVASLQTGQDLP